MKGWCKLLLAVSVLLIGYGCCTNVQSPAFKCGPSCETEQLVLRNTQFNHKTVANLMVGMPLPEFEGLYGPPDRSSANTLESKANTSFKNIIYEYDMGKHADAHYPDMFGVNKFYFNAEVDPPTLNRWDLDYVY